MSVRAIEERVLHAHDIVAETNTLQEEVQSQANQVETTQQAAAEVSQKTISVEVADKRDTNHVESSIEQQVDPTRLLVVVAAQIEEEQRRAAEAKTQEEYLRKQHALRNAKGKGKVSGPQLEKVVGLDDEDEDIP